MWRTFLLPSVLSSETAEKHNVDVTCLQETHVDADFASRFTITGFDLISYSLHAKHGRAICARKDLLEVSQQPLTSHCDVVKVGNNNIANVYKPPSEPWEDTNPFSSLPHPAIYVGDFNSHHTDWVYDSPNKEGHTFLDWASRGNFVLVHETSLNHG